MKFSPIMGTGVIKGLVADGTAEVGDKAFKPVDEAPGVPESVFGVVGTITGLNGTEEDDDDGELSFGVVGTMTGLNGSVGGNCSGVVETGGSAATVESTPAGDGEEVVVAVVLSTGEAIPVVVVPELVFDGDEGMPENVVPAAALVAVDVSANEVVAAEAGTAVSAIVRAGAEDGGVRGETALSGEAEMLLLAGSGVGVLDS